MAQAEKAEMERNWKLSTTKALQVKRKLYLERYLVYIREYYRILPYNKVYDAFLNSINSRTTDPSLLDYLRLERGRYFLSDDVIKEIEYSLRFQ